MLVGLDVGAIRATAVAIDETGAVQASASAEYPPDGKASGGLERDASEWWRASQRALAEVAARAGGEIVGIGLTGQTAGAVFMDARGNVVRPAIVGDDRRALPQSVAITERVGRDRLLEITGNAVASDGLASTLIWVRDVEPVQFRHTRRVLAPKDYVRLMLTGEAVTDVTDASGTTLLDLRRRTWSGEILDALEIPPAWLPDVQESAAISGGLRPSMAGELGLPARLPIAAGASAEAAAAVGCGIVESGLISSSIRRDAVSMPAAMPFRSATACAPAPPQPGRPCTGGVASWAGTSLGTIFISWPHPHPWGQMGCSSFRTARARPPRPTARAGVAPSPGSGRITPGPT